MNTKQLAADIEAFIAKYAKIAAAYDPKYDDEEDRFNGPDSAMLWHAGKCLASDVPPARVHSDFGSGCYTDMQDRDVQREHDRLVALVNSIAE